jgi:sugar/nucleoside kinase (ribokinase family)
MMERVHSLSNLSFPLMLEEEGEKKRYDITAISDALTDLIVQISEEEFSKLSSTLSKGNSVMLEEDSLTLVESVVAKCDSHASPGGSPTNVIYGASNLGLKCAFIGCVGTDKHGYAYINNLRENGVDTYISIRRGASGICYTFVTPDAERSFGVGFGVTKLLEEYEIIHALIEDSYFLHFSLYELRGHAPLNVATRHAAAVARKVGCKISIDLADALVVTGMRDEFIEFLKDRVTVLFANEMEANALLADGSHEYHKLLIYADLVVVKLGDRGAEAYTKGGKVHADAYPVTNPVNTNGAGDNFQAGFFYGLIRNLPLDVCLRIGNFCGSAIIRRIGAQSKVKIRGIEYII